ncbi:MAG: DUF5933 domain-containing protein [Mycobacteriaceae bacterium]
MLKESPQRSAALTVPTVAKKWLLPAAALAFVMFVASLEVAARYFGQPGPATNQLFEFVVAPTSGPTLWAGLALALVMLNNRQRVLAVSAGVAIDVVFVGIRLLTDSRLNFGNGALWVLLGIAVYAQWAWQGEQRLKALKGVGLGFLLIVASKCGATWLLITSQTRPQVLDQYVDLADHALGNPSWVMGQIVDATGVVGYQILHTVYIQLPLAAIVVAVYQLRNGFPRHHLIRTFLLIGVLGPLVYMVFPVVGPIYAFGAEGKGFEVAAVWPNTFMPINIPSSMPFDSETPRNCMPSLHTAWAVAIFVHSREGGKWLRRLGEFWLVATLMATLGFGYHYGVDLVAGVVFVLTIEAMLRAPERGWGAERIRLVLGGFTVFVGLLWSYRYLSVPMAEHPEIFGPIVLGVMGVVIAAFYGTFYAAPESALARWVRLDFESVAKQPQVSA